MKDREQIKQTTTKWEGEFKEIKQCKKLGKKIAKIHKEEENH